MTTSVHPVVRVTDPAALIAAVPHLLGFHPADSLVLVALSGASPPTVRLTVRADLPPPRRRFELAGALRKTLRRNDIHTVCPIVVGGVLRGAAGRLPHKSLLTALRKVLGAKIAVDHALWVAETAEGAAWRCYGDCGCSGTVPDPDSSLVAAAVTAAGHMTFPGRDALAALVLPEDAGVLARREELINAVPEPEPGGRDADDVRRDLATVEQAVAAAGAGSLALDDDQIVGLTLALGDDRVRDACLDLSGPERAVGAEQLWAALTRGSPAPERAAPATLLAMSAYARGDGALAGLALEQATLADPGYPLAGVLRRVLDLAIEPRKLAVLATQAATAARETLAEEAA